jgi:hypothetical protein
MPKAREMTPPECGFCARALEDANGGICGAKASICWECLALNMAVFQRSHPIEFETAVKLAEEGSLGRAYEEAERAASSGEAREKLTKAD